MSGLQEANHVNNAVVLIFLYFQCLHLMYSEVAGVLVVSSGIQVESQIIFEPDYVPDFLSVFYDYDIIESPLTIITKCTIFDVAAVLQS